MCAHCNNTVFFESVRCIHCGESLAYFPKQSLVTSIEPLPDSGAAGSPSLYKAGDPNITGTYRLCANSADYGVCNSAVPADDPETLCEACRLNDVIPDLTDSEALDAWQSLERAKRRLLFSLHELGLPIESRAERPNGLQFSFMKDMPDSKVFTGHSDGLITINIAEASDPLREKLRKQLGESYRTVLGHFRHEIGHYYWDRLVKDTPWQAPCRLLFGDESVDYAESVKRHYAEGAPLDWHQHFVSSYATMHPWEDWAETWAHFMHLVDTLETARAYGLVLRPKPDGGPRAAPVYMGALDFHDFDALLDAWVPVTVALNSLNRSMGIIDPYPFVLCEDVIAKLRFVHDMVAHWSADVSIQTPIIEGWMARATPALSEQPAGVELPVPRRITGAQAAETMPPPRAIAAKPPQQQGGLAAKSG
jgi:hypothetical protein